MASHSYAPILTCFCATADILEHPPDPAECEPEFISVRRDPCSNCGREWYALPADTATLELAESQRHQHGSRLLLPYLSWDDDSDSLCYLTDDPLYCRKRNCVIELVISPSRESQVRWCLSARTETSPSTEEIIADPVTLTEAYRLAHQYAYRHHWLAAPWNENSIVNIVDGEGGFGDLIEHASTNDSDTEYEYSPFKDLPGARLEREEILRLLESR